MRNSRRSRGFTLLEVLVALAIVGLGITSVLQLMGSSTRAATHTQATTGALFVAEDLMEEISTLNQSELVARGRERGDYAEHERRAARMREGRSPVLEPPPDSPRYAYAMDVVEDRNDPGLYRVDLVVTRPDSRDVKVELATLRRFPPPEAASGGPVR